MSGGKWSASLGVTALVIAFGVSGVRAEILLGNGSAEANCYAGLEVGDTTGATISDETKATVYSCIDGTACDLDGVCSRA